MVFFWFRRDLRWRDNHGLYRALASGSSVRPVFIFDSRILSSLPKNDARVGFMHESLQILQKKFEAMGSGLLVLQGDPVEVWPELIKKYRPRAVYANRDYEPYAKDRDAKVGAILKKAGVDFQSFKDQVVFEKEEVITDTGGIYKVYTPYSKKWKLQYETLKPQTFPSERKLSHLEKGKTSLPSLKDIGFVTSRVPFPSRRVPLEDLKSYAQTRDYPSREGTTRMGVHLRFGTLSPRKAVGYGYRFSEVWLNELIWREFFATLLFHFPETVNKSFKPEYDRIEWRNDEEEFARWKAGETGYPLVDAGMRELARTGYMHNRVRMVVASFLCKHLLIDWRWGERWFAEKLLDFELSSNVGNWQWAAGCGADAAPYFRVFNPQAQFEKFDPEGQYVRRWVPEWETNRYPKPIVDHKTARDRALRVYAKGINKGLKGKAE